MEAEEVRIQIRNIEDRAYCMMYYNQKLRSARECRRIAIAKDNDVRRLLIEYASTKAEEDMREVFKAGRAHKATDGMPGVRPMPDFDEWFTQYKKDH